MAGRVQVIYSSDPREDPARFTLGLKDGLRAAGPYWQRTYAPGHFRKGASSRYGYAPRTAKYNRRKRRLFGHQQPLKFTGTTERWVRTRFAQGRIRNVGGNLQGILTIVTPDYFFKFRPAFQFDKVAEFVATTDAEAAAIAEFILDHVDNRMLGRRPRRRTARG